MRSSSFLIVCLGSLLIFQSCRRKNAGEAENQKADSTLTLYSEYYDFESLSDPGVNTEKAVSGQKSEMVNDKTEYAFGFKKRFQEMSSYRSIREINVSFKCWMEKKFPDATFVISIDDSTETKNIMWEGKPIVCPKDASWNDIRYNFKLNPSFIQPGSVLKLYIWNKGKNKFYYDDLAFDFVKLKK